MTLPASLAGLLTPAAYPHPVDRVELIETPTSWVLLAGDFAYKIKRPVRYAFIDLRDPSRRLRLCEEELRLNRRFAPQLYLDVCPIVRTVGKVRIGGSGRVVEHAVRMRRFPAADELDHLLETNRIEPAELAAFGRELARIHAGLPVAHADVSWGQPVEIQALMIRNLLECADAARPLELSPPVLALNKPMQRLLPRAAAVMAARRTRGRIRECHGDLHCRNIVRLGGELVAFDCLEYEPAFRWIDVADEIAFLASDLAARGKPGHAHAFVSGYLEASGDYHACQLLRLYEAHRALVRAKVAALSAAGLPAGEPRAALLREHASLIAHAARSLARQAPTLLLMHGLSGSGKTWLAVQLATALRAIHIRSDIERKRGAGLDALARSGSGLGADLYSPGASAAVYAHLARAAEDALAGGYTVIVDATFLLREQRAPFIELARRCAVPVHLVSCSAPDAVLEARIAARKARGSDPSEADDVVLGWQRSQLEPVARAEALEVIPVDTTDPEVLGKVISGCAS
jgi:aminoglycoside phosphotransferase family enzyme/predicted kinase